MSDHSRVLDHNAHPLPARDEAPAIAIEAWRPPPSWRQALALPLGLAQGAVLGGGEPGLLLEHPAEIVHIHVTTAARHLFETEAVFSQHELGPIDAYPADVVRQAHVALLTKQVGEVARRDIEAVDDGVAADGAVKVLLDIDADAVKQLSPSRPIEGDSASS